MKETITINFDIDTRSLRTLEDVISDLNQSLTYLNGTISEMGRALDSLKSELGESSGALGTLDAAANTAMAALGLLALSSDELKNIGDNIGLAIRKVGDLGKSLTAKKGLIGLVAGAFKLWPLALIAGGIWLLEAALNGGNDALSELNTKLEENRRAHREAIDEINTNERRSGVLINTLIRLNDRTGDVNEEREEAIRLIKILNGLENDLNLTYDTQTGLLTGNSLAVLEQERDRIAMNASLERSTQHFESLETAIRSENDANYENRGELERLRLARENMSGQLLELVKNGEEHTEQADGLRSALTVLDRQYDRLSGVLGEFNDDVDYHFNNWVEEQQRFEVKRNAFIAEHGLQYEILSGKQQEVVHRMLGYWEMYADMGGEMFRKIAYDADVNLNDIIANQEHNLRATKEWQDNLLILQQRYGDEVANHFREMGESGMAAVAAMAEDVQASYKIMEDGTFVALNGMADASGSLATEIVQNLEYAGEVGRRGLTLQLGEGAEDVIDIVDGIANEAPDTLRNGFEAAGFSEIGQGAMEEVAHGMFEAEPAVGLASLQVGYTAAQEVIGGFESKLPDFDDAASNAMERFSASLLREGPTAVRAMVENGTSAVDALEYELEAGQPRMERSARNLYQGFFNGVESRMPEVASAGAELFDTFANAYRLEAEERSPSRVFIRSGQFIVQGLIRGIENGQDQPTARMAAMVQNMNRAFQNSPTQFAQFGNQIMGGMTQALQAMQHRPVDVMQTVMQHLVRTIQNTNIQFSQAGSGVMNSFLQGLQSVQHHPISTMQWVTQSMSQSINTSQFTQIGQQIMQGLNQGLLNNEWLVMQTANRIANNIARTMQQALQINSPSRVMRDEVGRHIPSGVAAGIEKYGNIAMNSVGKLADKMVKINIPTMDSVINMRPMNFAGAGGYGGNTVSNDNRVVNNYEPIFEGAHIHWHNETDIRKTMEQIAWASKRDERRMW